MIKPRCAVLLLALVLPAGGFAQNRLTEEERREGWTLLFNGKDLAGWSGDPRLWKVDNGAIVGTTDQAQIEQNTFLVYEKPFADFHLKADVKLRNHNSGIQFRSTIHPGPGWVVSGYQADFSEDGEKSAWGNLYEERGRGSRLMKTPEEGWVRGRTVYHKGEWNTVEVRAEGTRLRLWLNGLLTIDLADDKTQSGVIALQLHRGEPMRVEFRNIKLKPLAAMNTRLPATPCAGMRPGRRHAVERRPHSAEGGPLGSDSARGSPSGDWQNEGPDCSLPQVRSRRRMDALTPRAGDNDAG